MLEPMRQPKERPEGSPPGLGGSELLITSELSSQTSAVGGDEVRPLLLRNDGDVLRPVFGEELVSAGALVEPAQLAPPAQEDPAEN